MPKEGLGAVDFIQQPWLRWNAQMQYDAKNRDIINVNKVGIGTSSPDGTLTIHSPTSSSGLLIYEDTDDTITHNFYISGGDDANLILYADGGVATIWLNTSGNSYFTGGKVGIGTSSPDGTLTIHSPTSSNGLLIYEDTDDTITHNFYISGGDDANLILYADGQVATIWLNTNGSSYFTGGNVGIGTSSPAGTLTIHTPTNSNGLLIYEDTDDTLALNFYIDGGDDANLVMYADGQVATIGLNTNGSSYFTGGNVGIGTSNPNAKLDISGVIKMREQAAADSDTAGKGQLWVKNTTPCELWFTDDAGTDTQIV